MNNAFGFLAVEKVDSNLNRYVIEQKFKVRLLDLKNVR